MKTLFTTLIVALTMNALAISYAQPIGKVKKQFDKVRKKENIHSGFFSLHSEGMIPVFFHNNFGLMK